MDGRQLRDADCISGLLSMVCEDAHIAAERDIWLAMAHTSCTEFSMAHELLDRAMPELKPPEEACYRAVCIRVVTHYLTGEYDRALEAIRDLLESSDPNYRGQASALRAWVAAAPRIFTG